MTWRHLNRWSSLAAVALVSLLYLANLPFYSGSSITPTFSWRMEHGRLKLEASSVAHTENFYVANNTEGLRFAPDWNFYAASDWFVNIPLWLPLSLCLAWTTFSWWPRRTPGKCRCGYSLDGLARNVPCPECGRAV